MCIAENIHIMNINISHSNLPVAIGLDAHLHISDLEVPLIRTRVPGPLPALRLNSDESREHVSCKFANIHEFWVVLRFALTSPHFGR